MENYSGRQLRELFHLLFLERLLKKSDPSLYVLKGGVNLRFYFNSPRYSEDMDIDVLGGSVDTLKKNVYKILEDSSFNRILRTYGVDGLKLGNPLKAKQTETTQRFKLRIITITGEEYPTKVEFSRRNKTKLSKPDYLTEVINPEIVRPYRRLSYSCQHYGAEAVINQKLRALAGRSAPQTRDPFDIYIMYSGGHLPEGFDFRINKKEASLAMDNIQSLDYSDYLGQVVEYLDQEHISDFKTEEKWVLIYKTVVSILQSV